MSTYANGTTAAPAANGRPQKKRSSGTAALAKNKMKAPGMKMAEWRAKSGERWGVAAAKMQEKFSKMGASMSYRVFSATHPLHPLRRKAAEDAAKEKKALATGKSLSLSQDVFIATLASFHWPMSIDLKWMPLKTCTIDVLIVAHRV